MAKKNDKTNVMRVLDQKGIAYRAYTYEPDPTKSGGQIAAILNEPEERVFKTLVTQGRSGGYYVFVVPVNRDLDLKKAAGAVGEKSIAMIKQRELLPLTGYVHGGCSPIGMKKAFPTVLDASADRYDTIFFSAGKVGCQVEAAPEALRSIVDCRLCDVTA